MLQQKCPRLVFDVGDVVSGSDSVSELVEGGHIAMNAPVVLDPVDRLGAGYYRVSTNIKTMAINVPVAWSPLDRDVEPEHYR